MSFFKTKRNNEHRTIQLAKHVGYTRIMDPMYLAYMKKHYRVTSIWRVHTGKAYRFLMIVHNYIDPNIWVIESDVAKPTDIFLEWGAQISGWCYFERPRMYIDYRKKCIPGGRKFEKIRMFKSKTFSVNTFVKNIFGFGKII